MLGKSKFQVSRFLDEKIKRIVKGFVDKESDLADCEGPLFLLGFNYGNITNCVALTKIYKLDQSVFPVVGLIFPKQSPTENDIKGIIKTVKQLASPPNGLGSFKKDKNEHLFLIYSYDPKHDEVDKRIFNITKGCFVRRKRLRLNIIDDPYYPRQFPRVSEDLFQWEDAESVDADDDQVDHLFFFIHGVGGICDVRFRSCVEVVADFKKMANELLSTTRTPTPVSGISTSQVKKKQLRKNSRDSTTESNLSDMTDVSDAPRPSRPQRVECLPVSWHSCTRRQTGINDQLNLIALNSVPTLRKLLNNVVLDALLYSSGPVYCQTIINNVGDEINRLYSVFMEKHPNFKGSVSLVGHSLGSVIVFDLLANQISVGLNDQTTNETKPQDDNSEINCDVHSSMSGQIKPGAKSIDIDQESSKNIDTGQPQESNKPCCGFISHDHNKSVCSDYKSLDELLDDMDLMKFSAIFHREHLDLQSILLLTDIDMKELKLPLGARRKLGNYINFKKVSLVASGMRLKDQINEATTQNNNSILTKTLIEKTIMDNMKSGQYLLKYPQLKFKPRCFFAFGSPLPMFLNIRGVTQLGKSYKLPTCNRVFNIFHPYDPLAYRVEPLLDTQFQDLEPVLVPHHRGGKRIHVQLREGFSRMSTDIKDRFFGSIKDTWTSFARYTLPDRSAQITTSSSDVEVEIDSNLDVKLRKNLKRQPNISRSMSEHHVLYHDHIETEATEVDDADKEIDSGEVSQTLDSLEIGQLNQGSRIDYVLQEKPIELFNEYLFCFTSHANYWQNEDSALFMLKEIYKDEDIIFD